jgi:hypothetical protein
MSSVIEPLLDCRISVDRFSLSRLLMNFHTRSALRNKAEKLAHAEWRNPPISQVWIGRQNSSTGSVEGSILM